MSEFRNTDKVGRTLGVPLSELGTLDGVTSSSTELNYLVTSTTWY